MNNILDMWKAGNFNETANVEWWDSVAADFAKHDIPTADNNFTMRLITEKALVAAGDTVLDVGCGSGRFSIALAEMGAKAVGIDVSAKMIEAAHNLAKGKENVTFFAENWHITDLAEKKYEKAFDFVLANMTPAVIDAASFLKLSQASRSWCMMVKPFNRKNDLYDTLNVMVGAPSDKNVADEAVSSAFAILWKMGYRPYFEYDKQVWHNKKPIDEMINQYTKRIATFCALDDAKTKVIHEYISSQGADGFVEETTHTEIVAIYWNVASF